MFELVEDTIVAISSAPGSGARGIVRCSGPSVHSLATQVFTVSGNVDIHALVGFRRLIGTVQLEDDCEIPAEMYFFRAPHSYTRQDCVEFHLVGAPALLSMLMDRLVSLGSRPAEPGEFTARAFMAGAIDLTGAEAVAQTIQARSDQELRAARRMMTGSLADRVESITEQIAELVALVEADIDFAEEPIDFISPSELIERLSRIGHDLTTLVQGADSTERIDVAPRILLIGRPNAGKSTLMNRLSKTDRSICSPIPGTTRDILSASIELSDEHQPGARMQALLLDAAGVDQDVLKRSTAGEAATTAMTTDVDLHCVVVDLATSKTDAPTKPEPEIPEIPRIVAANKVDLIDASQVSERLNNLRKSRHDVMCPISAKTGAGIGDLRRRLALALNVSESQSTSSVLSVTARQRDAIIAAQQAIRRCVVEAEQIDETIDRAEVLAFELREALDALGPINGSVTTEDLLGRVFASFCIGK